MSVQVWAVGSPWSRCKQDISTSWPAKKGRKTLIHTNLMCYYTHVWASGGPNVPVTPDGRGIWTLIGCRKCMLGVWERQSRGLTLAWGSPHSACTSDIDTCNTCKSGNTKVLQTRQEQWCQSCVGTAASWPVKWWCESPLWNPEESEALLQDQHLTPVSLRLVWQSSCPLLGETRP